MSPSKEYGDDHDIQQLINIILQSGFIDKLGNV